MYISPSGEKQRFSNNPPNSYVATVPNITKKNIKSTKISNNVGNEFSNDYTNLRIPGMELIVLKGRKIRITRIAETLLAVTNLLTHPIITTIKSNYLRIKA